MYQQEASPYLTRLADVLLGITWQTYCESAAFAAAVHHALIIVLVNQGLHIQTKQPEILALSARVFSNLHMCTRAF